jgi:hypothetical protein
MRRPEDFIKLWWKHKWLQVCMHDSNPVQDILFLLSTVLIMSGVIIRFKPVTFGGIGLLIFTIYTYYVPDINFLLVNVVGITFGMLIPGLALYLLKKDE